MELNRGHGPAARQHRVARGSQRIGHVDGAFVEIQQTAFDAREIENAVDHREQPKAVLVHVADIGAIALVLDGAEQFLAHEVGEADHRVERRFQFMAHGRKERALLACGFLRFAQRLPGRFLGLALLGDVLDRALVEEELVVVIGDDACVLGDPDELCRRGGRICETKSRTTRCDFISAWNSSRRFGST